ncbi:MAG TPA: hypothetical protein VG755_27465 [Nannocystaceae bacterium]|nr:hypothetical protein [Nannocystaceae bacterium]
MHRTAALALLLAPSAGCWLTGYETAVIESDDVRIETPDDAFRASGERGEVYQLAVDSARDTNAWVSDTVEAMGEIVLTLNEYPEDGRDGDWRVYGPYPDDRHDDLAWIVRISGDAKGSSMEVYAGAVGAQRADDMDLLLFGDVAVADSARNGGFAIDFDALNRHPELLERDRDATVLGGTINVDFARDTETLYKQVTIEFDGVKVDDGDNVYDFDGETYDYERGAKGEGTFHLGARSTFEDESWSGPEIERMAIDMRWTKTFAGRARGTILEGEDGGDLLRGDVEIDECFADRGSLTWRFLTEAYQSLAEPGYAFGDEQTCVFTDDELDGEVLQRG